MKAVVFLVIVAIPAWAQPVCPPVNFQQLAQIKLQNRPQKILSGLLRQTDQSFSQIEITGNIQSKTSSLVGVVSDVQASFFTCDGLAVRPPGPGPGPSRNKDPLGTASRGTIITDLAGDGVGAIVGLEPHLAPGQVVVATAKPDFTVRYAGGFPVGLTPLGMVAGDFNGDGKHDVAAVYFGPIDNSAPGGISLLLGSGDGDLEQAVNYPVGLGTIAATAWDFNGDGKDDLAVANYQDNTVKILFGAANGKLATGKTYKLDGFPSSIAAADVNGDGIPDLIISTFDEILTLLGNGDGTFRTGPATTIHTTQSFVATGDFNRDGKVDVALTDSESGFVHILQGKGDGTFNEVAQYLVGDGASVFYVEDFDRDGNPDLVFAAGHPDALITLPYTQTVGVLFGKGDGTFVGAPVYDAVGDANTIVAADFNGDGKLDLAVGGQILLSSGGSRFQTGAVLYGPMGGYSQSAAADLNGDGKVDLIVNNVVYLGNGDGTFKAPLTIPAASETSGLAIGDFNNDHKLDLAVANVFQNSVTFSSGKGDGTFGAGTSIPVGSKPIYLLSGDFNHDGNLDLAVANNGDIFAASDPGGLSILLGKGDGTFESALNYPVNHPNSISAGDFNKDGITDLIVTGAQPDFSYALVVFIGNGDGTFKPGVLMPTDFGPHNVAVADFNGDGKLDLVVPHCCGDTAISYLLGNGDGTFQKETPITSGGALASVVGDFNGDGKPDVAFSVSGQGYGGNAFVFVNLASASSGCAYTLGSTAVQSPLAGGHFAVTIQTTASCAWTVTGLPGWITVSGATSGTGPGSVALVVAANSGAARSAVISIAGTSVMVNQAGTAACTYAISPGGQAFTVAGGSGTISVVTQSGCAWSATGAPAWVTISTGGSGSGNGTIHYQALANSSGSDRAGTITIAGLIFRVEEAAPITGSVSFGSMSQIASAGGWKTTITLINIGVAAARAQLNFFDNNGNALTLPLFFPQSPLAGPLEASTIDRTLNAGAVLVIESTGPASDAVQVGWAQMINSGSIGGYAIFTTTTTNQEAVVPLETRNSNSYLLAFDDTGGVVTGLAIASVGAQAPAGPANFPPGQKASPQATNVPLIIRNDAGAQVGNQTIPLSSRQHTSFLLAPTYPVTAGIRGTVEFDTPAGSQISVLGLRADGPALTTLPVLANLTAGGGSMAQVASAGGWKTIFTLVNADMNAAQATLSFFDNNGNPLSLPLSFPQTGANVTTTATVTRTLAPGALLVIETQGNPADAVVVGSARLTTAAKVGGFAIFRDGGTGQEAVVPLETRKANAYILAFDNANGLATGLALANLSGQAVSVPLVLRDDQGSVLGTPAINLAAGGHISFLLAPTYAATSGKRGSVEFGTPAGSQISVLGLRATPTGTLTTVPVLVK